MSHYTAAQFFNQFRSLPLEQKYRDKAQKFSLSGQFSIALIINLLSLALPIMMLQVYDRIIPHAAYGTLAMLTLGIACALGIEAYLRTVRAYLTSWSSASHEHATSCAIMDRFSSADINLLEKTKPGEHLQNIGAIGRLREFYSGQSLTAVIDLPFAALFLMMIAYIGGPLVIIPLMLLAVFFMCAWFAGHQLRQELENRTLADGRKSSFIVSLLTGIHTVKSLGLESLLLRKFEKTQGNVTHESYRVALANGLASTLSAAFGQLSLILTVTFGCLLVLNGELTIGGLSACTLLAGRTIQPVQRVLGTWLRLQDLGIAHAQVQELLSIPVQKRAENYPQVPAEGSLILDRVSFSYAQDRSIPLLENITLEVKPGDIVTIQGDKGCGKSSLLQLIAGLLIPQGGKVLLDGIEPSSYSPSRLRNYVGYMPQQGAIFQGTIMENLSGFRNDDESLEQARQAAIELGLDKVINQLPRGYQTILADTSADPVPPGIKQRIALTRVLARRPSLLLFDDADRALDKDGYNLLFRLIGKLKGRCSVVMVTSDQNLMSFSDRFYQLHNGHLQQSQANSVQNLSVLIQPERDRS